MTTEEMLERLSFLCARTITKFGDLTPMEVEAVLRSEWETTTGASVVQPAPRSVAMGGS